MIVVCFFFCKQKTAYEMRISDWSSDVCSSDLRRWVLRRGPEAVEHAPLRLPLGRGLRLASAAVAGIANRAWIFAHLAHGSRARAKDLHRRAFRPFRQSDLARQSAPVGESTNLRVAVAGIIRRHILRPLARERAGELALVGEVVATVMELHPVAMPRQRHIGRMAVHAGGGEDMRPIDRHALRFMDGGGIAMIDMGKLL